MRLYRFQGSEAARPVSAWVTETDEYRNMMSATGRWFTDSLEEALWYACDHEEGFVVHLDLDDDIAEQWRVSNLPRHPGGKTIADNPAEWSLRPEVEFFLPTEIASKAVPLNIYSEPELEKAAPRM